ncbi:hypothetical protein [Pontiella sp.]|uniref:hypothetical protein n=1 Tax=Pontiella sp. TaxID=2837462 RepID=UPI003567F988
MKWLVLVAAVLVVSGCASVGERGYRPATHAEKKAFARADRSVSPQAVRSDFVSYGGMEVAWAGIIKNVQYSETERTYLIAFEVEHCGFDWTERGGTEPFRLTAPGEGTFTAGWYANKPTRVSYLQLLAAPGDMLIVYGKPHQMKNGVVQLAATAIRPVKVGGFAIHPSAKPQPAPAAARMPESGNRALDSLTLPPDE